MRTIYTIILASGLYTDGQTTASAPIPMPQPDCVSISQLHLDGAECIQLQWPHNPWSAVRLPMETSE